MPVPDEPTHTFHVDADGDLSQVTHTPDERVTIRFLGNVNDHDDFDVPDELRPAMVDAVAAYREAVAFGEACRWTAEESYRIAQGRLFG